MPFDNLRRYTAIGDDHHTITNFNRVVHRRPRHSLLPGTPYPTQESIVRRLESLDELSWYMDAFPELYQQDLVWACRVQAARSMAIRRTMDRDGRDLVLERLINQGIWVSLSVETN
jgi:hypothetical protein